MKTLAKAMAVAWVMVAVAGSNLGAREGGRQVGVDSNEAELWQNMREGGLISYEEYLHALQYGVLPGRVNVEPAEGLQAAADAARRAQEAAWARNGEKYEYWHHQGLSLENGEIQSFAALREKKRAELRAGGRDRSPPVAGEAGGWGMGPTQQYRHPGLPS